jgi:hypothetical protein
LPLLQSLDIHGKLRLLLDDEVHAGFDVFSHSEIIA